MTATTSLLSGVRNEIARMWKVKDVGMQSTVKPLTIRKITDTLEKKSENPALRIEHQKAASPIAAKSQQSSGSAAEKKASSETTYIGEHITIEGTIKAAEDLIIDGSVHGTIEAKSHSVGIGKKGRVAADIFADDVSISGRAKGAIKASGKVHIARTAEFEGHVNARSISVEDGAFLQATIELDRDTDARQQPSPHRLDAIVFGNEERQSKPQLSGAAKPAPE